MKIRKREWSLVLSALALVVASACSTVKTATGMNEVAQPNLRAERLQGIPDSQLGDVKSEQQKLDQARQAWDQSKKDTENVASRIDYAKSNLDLAKAEVKSVKERGQAATKEVPSGAEQRAAQEEPAPISDLHAAEVKVEAAKARVDYLEKLHDYAQAREDVARDLVDVAQARVDNASYLTLERVRPDEARSLKMTEMDYRKAVTERETRVEKARADMEKKRSKAITAFDFWQQRSKDLRPEDRGETPPAPDSLPIL